MSEDGSWTALLAQPQELARCLLCDEPLRRLAAAVGPGRAAESLCRACGRDPVDRLVALALYEWHKGNALGSSPACVELADQVRLAAWGLRLAAEEAMRWQGRAGRQRPVSEPWRAFVEASDTWLRGRQGQPVSPASW